MPDLPRNQSDPQERTKAFVGGCHDLAAQPFPVKKTSWLMGAVYALCPLLDKRPRYRIPFVTLNARRIMLNPEWVEARYELRSQTDECGNPLPYPQYKKEIVELGETGWIYSTEMPVRGNIITFNGDLVPVSPYKYLDIIPSKQ